MGKGERQIIEISWASLWRILFFLILGVITYQGRHILMGLFLAIAISSGLEVMVSFLGRRRIPRTLGVILIFVVGILALVIFAYLVLPLFIIDAKSVFSMFDRKAATYWFDPLINFSAGNSNSISVFLQRISGELFSSNPSPLSFVSDVLGGLGLVVTVLVSSFYLSLSRDGVERFIKTVMPADYENQALRIYQRSRRKIGSWFRSQVMLSLTMALLTWLALYLLGVKYAFVIGMLAGLFELVPFVGPILSGALAFMAALSTSTVLALTTLIVFIIIHEVEANFLVPVFSHRVVGVHPVIVIIALLIGLEMEGVLGALIAVPAAAVIQEVIEEWSNKKKVPIPPVDLPKL